MITKPTRQDAPDMGSLTFLYEPRVAERRRTRVGVGIAVLAHVALFIINWPTIARSAPEPPEPPVRVHRLRPFRPAPPSPPPPAAVHRTPVDVVSVPIPGPVDQEPTIVREDVFAPEEPDSPGMPGPPAPHFPQAPTPPPERTMALVGVDVEPPALIYKVEPRYTETARQLRKEGAVILSLTIGRTGRVDKIEVLRRLPFGLTEEAVKAASQWIFQPSTIRGLPVRVQYILTVRFSLS